MAIFGGSEYSNRINDGRVVLVGSKKINSITEDPNLLHSSLKLANLFDAQNKANKQLISFCDQTSEHVHTALIIPRSVQDLKNLRNAFDIWAAMTWGFASRSPDYMFASLTAFSIGAKSKKYSSSGRLEKNLFDYLNHVRRGNLCLSHSFSKTRITKSNSDLIHHHPLKVTKRTSSGVFISGIRTTATLCPLSDEIIIFGAGQKLNEFNAELSISFATPVNVQGLSVHCREPLFSESELNGSNPFYDEMDSTVVFNNVFVPDERIFIENDVITNNDFKNDSPFEELVGLQSLCRVVKAIETLLGLAHTISKKSGTSSYDHVKTKLSAIAVSLDILKACISASIEEANSYQDIAFVPNKEKIRAGLLYIQNRYNSIVKNITEIAASGLVGPLSPNTVLDKNQISKQCNAEYLLKLLTIHSFGGRSALYEQFYFGSPQSRKLKMWDEFDKSTLNTTCDTLLNFKA